MNSPHPSQLDSAPASFMNQATTSLAIASPSSDAAPMPDANCSWSSALPSSDAIPLDEHQARNLLGALPVHLAQLIFGHFDARFLATTICRLCKHMDKYYPVKLDLAHAPELTLQLIQSHKLCRLFTDRCESVSIPLPLFVVLNRMNSLQRVRNLNLVSTVQNSWLMHDLYEIFTGSYKYHALQRLELPANKDGLMILSWFRSRVIKLKQSDNKTQRQASRPRHLQSVRLNGRSDELIPHHMFLPQLKRYTQLTELRLCDLQISITVLTKLPHLRILEFEDCFESSANLRQWYLLNVPLSPRKQFALRHISITNAQWNSLQWLIPFLPHIESIRLRFDWRDIDEDDVVYPVLAAITCPTVTHINVNACTFCQMDTMLKMATTGRRSVLRDHFTLWISYKVDKRNMQYTNKRVYTQQMLDQLLWFRRLWSRPIAKKIRLVCKGVANYIDQDVLENYLYELNLSHLQVYKPNDLCCIENKTSSVSWRLEPTYKHYAHLWTKNSLLL